MKLHRQMITMFARRRCPSFATIIGVTFLLSLYIVMYFFTDYTFSSLGLYLHYGANSMSCSGKFTLRYVKLPFRAVEVEATGDLLERICLLNAAMSQLRQEKWVTTKKAIVNKFWIDLIENANYSTSEK